AAQDGFDCVAIAGGDGTINETVMGLREGAMLPILLVPTGSTNLVAQELGVPKASTQAIRLLEEGEERPCDLANVTSHDRIMVTSVAVGYGSRIVEDAKEVLKNFLGYPAYIVAAVKNIIRVPTASFTCTVDGVSATLTGQMAMVSNMNMTSLKLVNFGPRVRPDDGKLNLIVFNHSSVTKMVELVANMVLFPDKPKPELTILEGTNIAIRATPTLPVTIDGEMVQGDMVRIACLPSAMTVIVPKKTKHL
ncbi:MAG: NAD(+)/NADH kinase, partial [Candidatus Kerfeldbacteria bacterium]|nr:NAD(+)/NADH kinase [Candidatus Kerfeldbacteria bacterium]